MQRRWWPWWSIMVIVGKVMRYHNICWILVSVNAFSLWQSYCGLVALGYIFSGTILFPAGPRYPMHNYRRTKAISVKTFLQNFYLKENCARDILLSKSDTIYILSDFKVDFHIQREFPLPSIDNPVRWTALCQHFHLNVYSHSHGNANNVFQQHKI